MPVAVLGVKNWPGIALRPRAPVDNLHRGGAWVFHDMTAKLAQVLSLYPRPGRTHVRAGQVLVVHQPHEVSTKHRAPSPPTLDDDHGEATAMRPPAGPTVLTRSGDLALEVVDVSSDRVIGYTFLSGPAARVYHQTEPMMDVFRPARLERLTKIEAWVEELGTEVPPDREREIARAIVRELERAMRDPTLMGALAVLDVAVDPVVAMRMFGSLVDRCDLGDQAERDRICHLFLLFQCAAADAWCALHQQPQRDAGWPCSAPFQLMMLFQAQVGADLSPRSR